jgi:hypothetical protein
MLPRAERLVAVGTPAAVAWRLEAAALRARARVTRKVGARRAASAAWSEAARRLPEAAELLLEAVKLPEAAHPEARTQRVAASRLVGSTEVQGKAGTTLAVRPGPIVPRAIRCCVRNFSVQALLAQDALSLV